MGMLSVRTANMRKAKTEDRSRFRLCLVFPEHYEEAVENTPARILFTQHHGSGNNYRQCFYNKEADFRKYDSLFYSARAQDKTDVITDLVFSRLMYPAGLTEEARKSIRKLYQRIRGADGRVSDRHGSMGGAEGIL